MRILKISVIVCTVLALVSFASANGYGAINSITIGQTGWNGIPTGCIAGVKVQSQMFWIQNTDYGKYALALAISEYNNGNIVSIFSVTENGIQYLRSIVPDDRN